MNAIVYEPFVHFIPTGEGWVRGLESLKYEVYKLPSFQYNISDIDGPVDLLIVHDVNPKITLDIINYKNSYPNTGIAVLCSTYEPWFDDLMNHVDLWFNLSIKNTFLMNMFGVKGKQFKNIQLAAHPQYSFPMNLTKEYDVSFFGQIGSQGHGYREEDKYLYPVIEKGYKGIYGGFSPYPSVPYVKLNEIYNKTKVNLNFHYTNQKIETPSDYLSRIELNGRVFDIALSGNFQICDHPYISQFFEDSIPYVKPEDWLDTIDYYLTHDQERNSKALKAREIALKNHTYTCRAKEILKPLGLYYPNI